MKLFRSRKASLPVYNPEHILPSSPLKMTFCIDTINPLQRCQQCQYYESRCHKCSGRMMQCLRSNYKNKRVKLISPNKLQKKPKIQPGQNQTIYKVSNMTIRRIKDKGSIFTFEQPVIHKNTILYNINQNITDKSRTKSTNFTEDKKKRNLMLNFNYISNRRDTIDSWRYSSMPTEKSQKRISKTYQPYQSLRKSNNYVDVEF